MALGVDIGGSHITTGIVDIEERKLEPASVKRKFIDSKGTAIEILDGWSQIISESFAGYNPEEWEVGIAMPGPFDYEKGISLIQDQDKFKSLYQVDVKEELGARLKIEPENIRFINDAAAFLQGEVFAGAARERDRVMGLTLGTGLGSAFYLNGKATDAALWNADFLDSIAEHYLSTQWFIKRYEVLTGIGLKGVKELVEQVQENDCAARVFKEFGHNLAEFLIPVVNRHQIDLVVIGGNIAQAFTEFEAGLSETFNRQGVETEIQVSVLKEDAALIGAASCWSLINSEQ